MLSDDRQENQQQTNIQYPKQIEVTSGLSALYPVIEQRRDCLPRDLNDKLEPDSDESITEDPEDDNIIHNEIADTYESSLPSAQMPRRNGNNGI